MSLSLFRLEDNEAIVTGASRGIGKAAAGLRGYTLNAAYGAAKAGIIE